MIVQAPSGKAALNIAELLKFANVILTLLLEAWAKAVRFAKAHEERVPKKGEVDRDVVLLTLREVIERREKLKIGAGPSFLTKKHC
jgi:hypothetical protein